MKPRFLTLTYEIIINVTNELYVQPALFNGSSKMLGIFTVISFTIIKAYLDLW